jgi:hypothetical protein
MPVHDWSRVRAGKFHHFYINVPLEETYLQAWEGFPPPWKEELQG